MALWLIETAPAVAERSAVVALLDRVSAAARNAGGDAIDAQVAAGFGKAFVVVEHADQTALTAALTDAGITAAEIAEVRLVGDTVENVKARRGAAGYLVEWDFPTGLTMDTYLARKQEKSPLYASIPEVTFLRTYVREDMVKCLCFYDAPDEDAVVRARQIVSTPVDRLTRLEETQHVAL